MEGSAKGVPMERGVVVNVAIGEQRGSMKEQRGSTGRQSDYGASLEDQ